MACLNNFILFNEITLKLYYNNSLKLSMAVNASNKEVKGRLSI